MATRERIVEAAAELLATGGREAVSTRAVSAAAGVQAPTIYRLFGDKQGLLDAVAGHGIAEYLHSKIVHDPDPVADLRRGWDLHVGFGLANPAFYALMYGDPHPGDPSPAAQAALRILRGHVRRIAEVGRLRVPEEHAVQLVQASGTGTVLTLLATPQDRRDPTLSAMAREACIAAITTDTTVTAEPGAASAAVALSAALDGVTTLTASELGLLRDWLTRIAAYRPPQ